MLINGGFVGSGGRLRIIITGRLRIFLNISLTTLLAVSLALVWPRREAKAEETKGIFRVGAIVPLTGPLADYGEAVRRGFESAKRERPERFTGVEFVYQDSAYDGKTALSALQALISRGDINLFYAWGVTPNEALLPVLHARSAVVGKPLSIRAAPTGDMTAKVLAAELVKRGSRSIGVLLVDIPYYRDIVRALEAHLKSSGTSVEVVDTFSPEVNDFKSTITKLRSKGYDSIGVFLLNDQVVTYYKQANALKFAVQTFGASIHDSQELMTRAGQGAEGAIFVGYDVAPEFQSRWLKDFNDDSRIGCGANAYDTALMIAELFGDGSSVALSAAETVSRFANITTRNGVSGSFAFAETAEAGKHFDFPLSARIIKRGRIAKLN
jgi:ABC-type branched-subunit amino acid transport system substrate-binding protein